MSLRIQSCAPGTSFFKFVEELWAAPSGNDPLHRICTMMRWMCARSVVIEEMGASFDDYPRVAQEIEAVQKRIPDSKPGFLYKITFLRCETIDSEPLEKKILNVHNATHGDFLGYAIIVNFEICKRFKRTWLFEAIIQDLSPNKNTPGNAALPGKLPTHYLHVKKHFTCSVLGNTKHYAIVGTYFRQQNAITNVCAHACATMMLNNCKENAIHITCEEINKKIGIDHQTHALIVDKRYGTYDNAAYEGIDTKELSEKVFPAFGFKSETYTKKDFQGFLYGFIESGYPALLTFETPKGAHVVAVVGHTWNPHSWFPSAFPSYNAKHSHYLSSFSWINDFLVHDDNFGMQLAFPAYCLANESQTGFKPIEALGIFPAEKHINLLAPAAEITGLRMLNDVFIMLDKKSCQKDNYYVNHLRTRFDANVSKVVLRTSLVERDAFLEHLKLPDNKGQTYDKSSLDGISQALAHHDRIWLVEVTEPDLYVGNMSKVIDVIIDPTFDSGTPERPNDLRKALIMVRFPEFLIIPKQLHEKQVEYFPPIPLHNVKGYLSLLMADSFGKS